MQRVELFYHAGDIKHQINFIIRPEGNLCEIKDDFLTVICNIENEIFSEWVIPTFYAIEKYLKDRNMYPDPIKLKKTSDWYFSVVRGGSIICRICLDGRRESGSNRINPSFEGAFLAGVDLEKTKKKYEKKGINIIEEIGNALPQKMEQIIVDRDKEFFNELKGKYEACGQLNSLYNHFYVNFHNKKDFSLSEYINTRPLCSLGLSGNLKIKVKNYINELL